MRGFKPKTKTILSFACLIIFLAFLTACSTGSEQTFTSLESLDRARLGILTGSIYDNIAKQRFPNATLNYLNGSADLLINLKEEKVDGILLDYASYVTALWEGEPLLAIDTPVAKQQTAFMFAKNSSSALKGQLNEFIAKSKQDGTIDRLKQKWLGGAEPAEHPDYSSLTGTNGTIKVAAFGGGKPQTYLSGDSFTGLETELLTLFAKEYGYKLDFQNLNLDAVVPAVTTNKADIGAGGIAITAERAQSVDFSNPYTEMDGVMVIKSGQKQSAGFFADIAGSFYKTFIKENRWKLIVRGLLTTLLISACAIILGSLLGFGLYMATRSKNKPIKSTAVGIGRVYSRIVAGTPVLVILMILYYVIFGAVRNMSGALVSVICFALTFGAFVYENMRVAVDAIDKGQTEAAYALGYGNKKTFFRIIFPQAMVLFLPVYCAEAVALIKATSIVGYIAVTDLTKAGDIIRSNTYEAFFPLIAVAVIYFLLTWAVSVLLGLIKIKYEPKRRSREVVLRGIAEND